MAMKKNTQAAAAVLDELKCLVEGKADDVHIVGRGRIYSPFQHPCKCKYDLQCQFSFAFIL